MIFHAPVFRCSSHMYMRDTRRRMQNVVDTDTTRTALNYRLKISALENVHTVIWSAWLLLWSRSWRQLLCAAISDSFRRQSLSIEISANILISPMWMPMPKRTQMSTSDAKIFCYLYVFGEPDWLTHSVDSGYVQDREEVLSAPLGFLSFFLFFFFVSFALASIDRNNIVYAIPYITYIRVKTTLQMDVSRWWQW